MEPKEISIDDLCIGDEVIFIIEENTPEFRGIFLLMDIAFFNYKKNGAADFGKWDQNNFKKDSAIWFEFQTEKGRSRVPYNFLQNIRLINRIKN